MLKLSPHNADKFLPYTALNISRQRQQLPIAHLAGAGKHNQKRQVYLSANITDFTHG